MSHVQDDQKLLELRRVCLRNGLPLTDGMLRSISGFVSLLRDWNTRINLISRRDVDNIWEAHILHSLGILFEYRFPDGVSVLDLGTGGGLPGIPISIARPDTVVTMLDATRKKIDAVNDMVKRLGLERATGVWGRAEDGATLSYMRGSFDIVVARAVGPLEDLVQWSRPFLRDKGEGKESFPRLVTLKGGDLEHEVERAKKKRLVREVSVKALTFEGAETIPGIEKKIVSVYF